MAFEQTLSFRALGTVNTVTVREPGHGAALEQIEKTVCGLNDRLSVFLPDSELSRLNRAAGQGFVPVSPDTAALLAAAKHFSALTGGAFSATCLPITSLWRKSRDTGRTPERRALSHAAGLVRDDDLMLDGNAAALRRAGQGVDLGGIAKGYAADAAAKILQEDGVKDASVNFGGTVICLGEPETVGIQHPRRPTGCTMGRLTVRNRAVVTSGDYERFFDRDGLRCHHILDPRTGRSTDSGLCSVTLIGENACALDALSTAVFVLGAEKGAALVRAQGLDAVFITDKLDILCTENLRDSFLKTA